MNKVCTLLITLGATASLAFSGEIISTFDEGDEGWTRNTPSDPAASISWFSTGGNPGGYIRFNEPGQGTVDFFNAPAMFLGNQGGKYGGELSFDLRINGNSNSANVSDGVRLVGAGLTLTYEIARPTTEWQSYEIPLIEGDWRVGGVLATEAQLRSVLSDLDRLNIRADWIIGAEQVSLDNVRLVPAPGSAAVLAMAGMIAARRRRVAVRSN